MARVAAILQASADAPQVSLALAAASTATFTLSKNRPFAVNADQDITVAFGLSSGHLASATASSYRIPANQQSVFDLGFTFDQIQVYNLGTQNGTGGQTGTTAANVYVQPLSVV
jgi:hypothetical protein